MRSVVPYYPLLMQTRSDTLLYQVKGDKTELYDAGAGHVCRLLASDNYAYVLSEGGAGAYDSAATSAISRLRICPWRRPVRASAWRRRMTPICRSSC